MKNKKPVYIIVLKILLHVLIFSFLTIVTHIGGIVYLITVLSTKNRIDDYIILNIRLDNILIKYK